MRLDIYLKLSRLIPRRSLAQEFCDAGLIDVNGIPAKSSKEIKTGDSITIRRRNRITQILVEGTTESKQLSKESSGSLYKLISEENIDNE